ncbi:hypothetical protein LJC60_01290 [Ruminococcaceae bacterium OttesenSCG-928-D13]|nr:hypothetical protein [Ruminococcaceae bacterium OttesenSCG-928-D13]
MIVINGLRLPLGQDGGMAVALALKKAGLTPAEVASAGLRKVSVDARRKPPQLVYSVALTLKDPAREAQCARKGGDVRVLTPTEFTLRPGAETLPGPVIVCGLGPAGLFCALELAEAGYAPLVLERGPAMDERRAAVEAFEAGGALSENANIQFGEGGAGTFSDGKLRTRIGDALCHRVTARLLAAGAPDDIAWRSHPHIGTDRLRDVFVALRGRVEELGGRVLFNTRLESLEVSGGLLRGVGTSAGAMPCGALVLACGHSARDTFEMLDAAGAGLEPKSFSAGFRIEHLQKTIDAGLYHEAAGHPALPPGEYQLATKVDGTGVYTFCMCPGGTVVAAASEAGGVVTNGMSTYRRDGENANSAVVANVDAAAFAGPMEAVAFQRRLEQAAFAAGGGGYTAPAQSVGAFLTGQASLAGLAVNPSYPRGVQAADLGALLPEKMTKALRGGLAAFGRKLPGFDAPGAVLTGLETRTSSPVRVPRDEAGESPAIAGLWPCGEGAGYAGGIMSAAVDGIRTAAAIAERYRPPGR